MELDTISRDKILDLKTYKSTLNYNIKEAIVNKQDGIYRIPSQVDGKYIHTLHSISLVYPKGIALDVLRKITKITFAINGSPVLSLSGLELMALCIVNPRLINHTGGSIRISFTNLCFSKNKPLYVLASHFAWKTVEIIGDYTDHLIYEYSRNQPGEIYDELKYLTTFDPMQVIHQIQDHERRPTRWVLLYTKDFQSITGLKAKALDLKYECVGSTDLLPVDTAAIDRAASMIPLTRDTVSIIKSYMPDCRTVYIVKVDSLNPFETLEIGNPLKCCNLEFSASEPICQAFISVNALVYSGGAAYTKYS